MCGVCVLSGTAEGNGYDNDVQVQGPVYGPNLPWAADRQLTVRFVPAGGGAVRVNGSTNPLFNRPRRSGQQGFRSARRIQPDYGEA